MKWVCDKYMLVIAWNVNKLLFYLGQFRLSQGVNLLQISGGSRYTRDIPFHPSQMESGMTFYQGSALQMPMATRKELWDNVFDEGQVCQAVERRWRRLIELQHHNVGHTIQCRGPRTCAPLPNWLAQAHPFTGTLSIWMVMWEQNKYAYPCSITTWRCGCTCTRLCSSTDAAFPLSN